MTFHVIVTGVRHFHDYPKLRDLLDRPPDVVILSGCGRGTDALATSYALERGLVLVPYPIDFDRHPVDSVAVERRNARMVADADAAVVVWDRIDPDLGDLIGRCRRKGIPVRVLAPADAPRSGGGGRPRREPGPPDGPEPEAPGPVAC